MRTFAVLTILALAPQVHTQLDYGSIEGVVTRLGTNEPIRDAQIVAGSMSTTTDGQGKFRIDKLLPGTYDVTVSAGSYLLSAPLPSSAFLGQRVVAGNNLENVGNGLDLANQLFWRVAVQPNEHISDAHLRMVPSGIVSGKVLTSRGEPFSKVSIVVLARIYRNGQTRLLPLNWRTSALTNDRGEYRIFTLPPGEYYILAQDRNSVRTLNASYFPGRIAIEDAVPVTIKEGEETSRIDITMPNGTPRTITGSIAYPFQGRPDNRTLITPIPLDPKTLVGPSIGFPQGSFRIGWFLSPQAGFDVFVVVPKQNVDYFGQASVPPGSGSIEELTIKVQPGFDVTGRIVLAEGMALPKFDSMRVDLISMTRIPYDTIDRETKDARVPDSLGVFTIQNMPSGKFAVVASLPSGMYVADIRQDMNSVIETGISIERKHPDPIEVIVRSDGATVEGELLDEQDQRVGFSRLVLIPERSRRQNASLFQIVNADHTGHFSFGSVPPGKYELYAWYGLPDGAWTDASFLERLDGRGTVLDLKAKDRVGDLRVRITRNR